MAVFAVCTAFLIALTSFLHGYSNHEMELLNPLVIVLIAGASAFLLETALQLRTK
jgi:hypothetical protein